MAELNLEELNFFFRGPYSAYNVETHGEGIYFATDRGIIKMGGRDYIGPLGDATAVKSITLNADGSKFVISYLDGTSDEIEMAKSEYESNIEDKTIAMTSNYGDFKSGTTVADLEGKTYNELFDGILFPTVNPTFSAPTASLSLKSYAATQEVGATAPTAANFTTGYNAGAINLNGVKQANRGGALDASKSFIYYGGSASNTTLPTTVAEGNTSYKYRAAYSEGPQPKDNKGNDYDSPLAAGTVDSSAVNVNGTWPWFASTSTATAESPVVKQSLVAWNATAGAMSTGQFTVQPSGTLPQVFKLPRKCSTLQMKNTVSGNMDTIGTADFNETTEEITINGNNRTYYVYTYKGSTRGEVTLLAKF